MLLCPNVIDLHVIILVHFRNLKRITYVDVNATSRENIILVPLPFKTFIFLYWYGDVGLISKNSVQNLCEQFIRGCLSAFCLEWLYQIVYKIDAGIGAVSQIINLPESMLAFDLQFGNSLLQFSVGKV